MLVVLVLFYWAMSRMAVHRIDEEAIWLRKPYLDYLAVLPSETRLQG